MKFTEIIVFFFIAEFCTLCWCKQDYTVENDQLSMIEGEEETMIDFSQLLIVGRERSINGTFEMLTDFNDEEFSFSAEMYSSPMSNDDYKKLPGDVPPTAICEAFKKFYVKFVQPSLIYDSNTNFPFVPDEGLCPFPKLVYYIKTVELNTESWPNSMPTGTLKVILKFYKNDVVVGGLIAKFKIEEKKD